MFARIFALQLVARLLHLVHNGRLYANATAIVSTTGPFDDSGTAAFAGSTAFDTRICLECMSEDYTGLACDVSELCGEAPDGSAGVCDMLGIGYDQWLGAGASDELANDDDDDRQDYARFRECKHNPNCSARVVIFSLTDHQRHCPEMQRTCVNYVATQLYDMFETCDRNPAARHLPPMRRARLESCLWMKSRQPHVGDTSQGHCDPIAAMLVPVSRNICDIYVPSM